ncbi:hypothetical protein AAG570_011716 [Ranatra chinensis]|uniref:Uncharacterized protein n=1 Tax=Ranatra chinensis TaxID=642074 RepID=A0ABD0YZ30_9HEMI
MILPAFVWVVCTLGADAVERRPVDDDMDEFLDAVNEAGQLYGIAYMEYPYGVLFADSAFSGLKIGELTSWQRKGEAYATGDSLQDFTVDAVVGLQVFQVLVANFSSGDYSGKMSILFLDNACSLRITLSMVPTWGAKLFLHGVVYLEKLSTPTK